MDGSPNSTSCASARILHARLGGADKVKRQHDAGKLTIRERIDGLVDRGSFHEVGAIAGRAEYDAHGNLVELVPSNCVMGRARIDGRAGRRGRRRFHGARRLGRRDDPRKAADGRADGA